MEVVSGSHHQTPEKETSVFVLRPLCVHLLLLLTWLFSESLIRRLKVMAHPRYLWSHQGDLGITKASAALRELPHSLVSSIIH